MQQKTRTALPHFNRDSAEETARIGHLVRARTGLHLIGVLPDGIGIVSDDPTELPAVEVHLAEWQGTEEKTLAAARVEGTRSGLDLVRWNKDASEVTYARLMPLARDLRARFAGERLPLHRVEAYPVFSADEPRLEAVVARLPLREVTADRRASVLAELAALIPGYTSGWSVSEDTWSGLVTFQYGDEVRLRTLVPFDELLPPSVKNDEPWYRLAIGKDAAGQPVGPNFRVGPHALVVGDTGSGKTVACRMLVTQALLHDWDVFYFDPLKQMLGLKSFIPWLKGHVRTAGDLEATASGLEAIYAEGRRRLTLISETTDDGDSWTDLPRGTVKPLLVIVDEYAGLASISPKPPGLKPGDAAYAAWEAQAGTKSRIRDVVGRIARELRAAGISLVLVLQRPDAKLIEGDVRQQLGSVIQLVSPTDDPDTTQLGMVFSTASAQRAMDVASQLGGDGRPGFALARIEGGPVTGFRVGFIQSTDTATALEQRGVPRVSPTAPSTAMATTPTATPTAPAPAADEGGFEWE